MPTKIADITLTKQTGTTLTLNQEGKYVTYDGYFDVAVQSGAGTVTIASTDASIQSDASGRNISAVIGSKSTTAPVSGYYFKVDASGTGTSTVTTAGWLGAGELGTASASGSFYFPIDEAQATVSGTNVVTPIASVTGTNVTLSNTDNGISINATGGGTASASASAVSSQAGYIPAGESLGTQTINAASSTTTAASFISGVTLTTPASGTRTFAITIPNGGSDTLTLTFTVDSEGNTTIE